MKSKGFTLIEILITVAIVGILAAIALPSYSAYVKKSKATAAATDLVTLSLVLENAFQKTLVYPVYATDTTIPASPAARTDPVATDFRAWAPSQGAAFSYSIITPTIITSTSISYTLTATGLGQMTGCTLTLTNSNVRTAGNASACGLSSW